ncbi:MAG: dolichol kinase [Cyanobium sp. ELA507]
MGGVTMDWWGRQWIGVIAVLVWLTLVASISLAVRARWPERGEWSRKVVHIGAGPVVLIAWALGIDRWVALPSAALATLLTAVNHRRHLLPGLEDVNRASYGTVAYGASITLLLLVWWPRNPLVVAAGVLVMAFADGLAGLVGPQVTSPSWRILGERRSLAGTATMALTSLVVLLALAALAGASGQPVPTPAALVGIALAAALLEQVGIGGLDNLSVPLAVAWMWSQLTVV